MRKALVRKSDGFVVNVILVNDGWVPPDGLYLVDAEGAGGPGDTWDGAVFIKPTPLTQPDAVEEAVKGVVDGIDGVLRGRLLAALTADERAGLTERLKKLNKV